MKVQVDATKCQGYGICVEIAPQTFELDEFGFASAAGDGELGETDIPTALEAVKQCPARAIRVAD